MFRKIGAAVVHYNVFSLHEGTEVLVPWDIEENSMKQSTEWENHGPTLFVGAKTTAHTTFSWRPTFSSAANFFAYSYIDVVAFVVERVRDTCCCFLLHCCAAHCLFYHA
jgi:hypothetical protein